MNKKSKHVGSGAGFTLVEMITVVAIIAILLTILAPSTVTALKLARRNGCKTQLHAIGRALAQYAHSNNSRGPAVDLNGGNCTAEVGKNRNKDPHDASSRSNSANLWMLWYGEYADINVFICPSADHDKEKNLVQPNGNKYTDFSSGNKRRSISYGYQVPYESKSSADITAPGAWTSITESGVVIAADRSPYLNSDGSWASSPSITDWRNANNLDDDDIEAGNSPNHHGEGQNVLYAGSNVNWSDRADVGIENDNIYTAASGKKDTDQQGEMDVPNSEVDSMIAP